ncbi:peptigoglycan-binding protein LysM, partial [Cribrihabitans sp. XS_ASV171]
MSQVSETSKQEEVARAPAEETADRTVETAQQVAETAQQTTETARQANGDSVATVTEPPAPAQLAQAQQPGPEPEAPRPSATPEPATDSGPVAILRSGREGVDLVQPAPGDPAVSRDQVALDTIGYSDRGEVRLSGRAQSGSTVRVYVDNRAVS